MELCLQILPHLITKPLHSPLHNTSSTAAPLQTLPITHHPTHITTASARSVLRASRALGPMVSAPRVAAPRAMGMRSFANSAIRFKSDVVREDEVPVSVYAPDSKGGPGANSDHYSIPVSRENQKVAPISTEENGDVTPLTDQVFNSLPPTMQRMSIKDKVVIVTG